jgi:ribonuclease VapC
MGNTKLIETSVIVAVLLEEDDDDVYLAEISAASIKLTSVVNICEAAISIGRRLNDFDMARDLVRDFVVACSIDVIDLHVDIYPTVLQAYARYGKGSGHKAKLNFGDCFSYALAKNLNADLIYKGNDFSHTDLAR